MPCHAAMIDKPFTLSPEMSVEKALKELKKKKFDAAAVVNEAGEIVGVFSLQNVMKNLLPVSIAMHDGVQLDVTVRAAPGIAKRLNKVFPLSVEELMDRDFHAVLPDTAIWEAVNILVNYGAPLFVVENEENKFLGVIDFQSAYAELQRLQES